jgi:hypothetical protein
MVVCQLLRRHFPESLEEVRHQDHTGAEEEEGNEIMGLAFVVTLDTEEEVGVERDSMTGGQSEAYPQASGEEVRRHQIEKQAMAGEEEEVIVETGVVGEEEDGSGGVRVRRIKNPIIFHTHQTFYVVPPFWSKVLMSSKMRHLHDYDQPQQTY